MAASDAQKSEVHNETADASSSPVDSGDEAATKNLTGHGKSTGPKPKDIPASKAQTIIISDESEDGGPIVIQSQEPSLQKVQAPQDPFPTEGIPDIDVTSDVERPAKLRPTKA